MIVTRQGNNAVEFLLDGDTYFQRLHQTLDSIRANASAGAGAQFVRMAFWQMSPDTFLPGFPNPAGGAMQAGAFLTDILEAIARLGVPVQLIAWAGTTLVNAVNAEMASNWRMRKWVLATNQRNAGLAHYRPIDIYMECYGGATRIGMSTHQKIVVASDGVTKEAYVGGMNLAQKYLSAATHDPVNRWHDAAVRCEGRIVEDIEGEWVRRWSKQAQPPAPAGLIAPPAAPVMNGLTVTMMTTNVEATPRETNILAQTLTRINAAGSYVYLEGYALTDPQLVTALAAARTAGRAVLPVVDHPRNQGGGPDAFAYLMFYTYVELALAGFVSLDAVATWRSWIRGAPITYNANAAAPPVVRKLGLNPNTLASFNPVNAFWVNLTLPGGQVKRIWFRDIWAINANPAWPVMYAPKTYRLDRPDDWTYPHAKVALVDDRYVLIGTSNWTYRSMQFDGEITLEIDDPPVAGGPPSFAQTVRQALFAHWGMPTAAPSAVGAAAVGANWVQDATANRNAWAGGFVPLSATRIVPLELTDFIHPASIESWKRAVTTMGAIASAYL